MISDKFIPVLNLIQLGFCNLTFHKAFLINFNYVHSFTIVVKSSIIYLLEFFNGLKKSWAFKKSYVFLV